MCWSATPTFKSRHPTPSRASIFSRKHYETRTRF
nr:MAG TPA: hypothetical protein [Caudoviricetes sp.]